MDLVSFPLWQSFLNGNVFPLRFLYQQKFYTSPPRGVYSLLSPEFCLPLVRTQGSA